ncbi:rab effector MyRIP-like isoform X2 [Stegostoma tigrinum]|uniref:rab effector MyRIP-like isoform X2 n=1 Tax=Stegostoma tigrinum TaxID=3053191 RepID=UPI00202B4AF4|nr:rab effector MyRIP-like isoform X2 [Stegostoma tigrinum]
MGKNLDLSGLTDDEAEHVLQVVQRDFDLRKKEQERLSELKQKLNEEGNKRTILSKQEKFNENCCIRCCSPFTFLINTKRPCIDCKFNICKNCGAYSKKEKAWICMVCHQARLLRTQSLEWYYNNVKGRFRHFGSAKVVHTLYKKRLTTRRSSSNVLGHTITETLAAALRVAEEAVEEAITKAESFSDSLEKQNESHYLQEHKEELIEELATTIMQKVIQRKKSGSRLTDSESEQSHSQNRASIYPLSIKENAPDSCSRMSHLWRSHSEFSLTSEENLSKDPAEAEKSSASGVMAMHGQFQSSESSDLRPYSLPSWKSMDFLDNAGSSAMAMMHSPDGNWMAMQSTPASRPRLLAKPKSRVFIALENEADIVSAYDEMGTDDDNDDDIGWSAADLGELRQCSAKLSDETYFTDSQHDNDWLGADGKRQPVTSPSSGRYTNTEAMCSDSETSSTGSVQISIRGSDGRVTADKRKSSHNAAKPASAHSAGQLDINYNAQPQGFGNVDSSEGEDIPDESERKHRRRRRNKCSPQEHETDSPLKIQQSLSKNTCQELSRCMFVMEQSLSRLERRISLGTWSREESPISAHKAQNPERKSNLDPDSGVTFSRTHADLMEEKLRTKLVRLATKLSDKESSSGDELDPDTTEGAQESSCDEDHKHIQDELMRKYSAISLCNITTEALKVINATEDLIGEATGASNSQSEPSGGRIPTGKEAVKLEEQLTKLEENIYITAGSVYSLEGQLNDLEDCARSIHSITTETELADLEDQVATAAAQVHQAELQVSDIERRISALNVAGLNVVPCDRLLKKRNQQEVKAETIDSSRQQRRKLPAPPKQGETVDSTPGMSIRTYSRNSLFQDSASRHNLKEDL